MGQAVQKAEAYTLYIGTTDKDTNAPRQSMQEARVLLDAICEQHTGGFTVYEAVGNWDDSRGIRIREDTLVYRFFNAERSAIQMILKEAHAALNTSAIVVEKESAHIIFYQ